MEEAEKAFEKMMQWPRGEVSARAKAELGKERPFAEQLCRITKNSL